MLTSQLPRKPGLKPGSHLFDSFDKHKHTAKAIRALSAQCCWVLQDCFTLGQPLICEMTGIALERCALAHITVVSLLLKVSGECLCL